mmetsp:Transcript_4951/g.12674  ORF Transcript_4951/g.12674 Transcript_4951/m.12674 type:complete len:248 (-) Transcript_4951:637-1380(-)
MLSASPVVRRGSASSIREISPDPSLSMAWKYSRSERIWAGPRCDPPLRLRRAAHSAWSCRFTCLELRRARVRWSRRSCSSSAKYALSHTAGSSSSSHGTGPSADAMSRRAASRQGTPLRPPPSARPARLRDRKLLGAPGRPAGSTKAGRAPAQRSESMVSAPRVAACTMLRAERLLTCRPAVTTPVHLRITARSDCSAHAVDGEPFASIRRLRFAAHLLRNGAPRYFARMQVLKAHVPHEPLGAGES